MVELCIVVGAVTGGALSVDRGGGENEHEMKSSYSGIKMVEGVSAMLLIILITSASAAVNILSVELFFE